MEEQLISFEVAKLAKEKGFDIHCRNHFTDIGECYENIDFPYNSCTESLFAPTQSLLQKWLREVHGIHIKVESLESLMFPKTFLWYFDVVNFYNNKLLIYNNGHNTYEQALEVALKQALKLIKT